MFRLVSVFCLLFAFTMPVMATDTVAPASGRYTLPLLIIIGAVTVCLGVLFVVTIFRKKR